MKKVKPILMIVLGILTVVFLAGAIVMVVKGTGVVGKEKSAVSKEDIKEAKAQELEDAETDEYGNQSAGMLRTPVQEKIILTTDGARIEDDQSAASGSGKITGIDTDYVFPESDTKYLTDADVSGLSKQELRVARNEILARHGRIFESEDLKTYFEGKSWYHATTDAKVFDKSMDNVLSDCEKANIELIKSYE